MSLLQVIGVAFGAVGAAVGGYAVYRSKKAAQRQKELIEKQERLEQQLERKEELQTVANNLSEVHEWLTDFHKTFADYPPHSSVPEHSDYHSLWGSLHHLCKDILAYEHATGKTPVLDLTVCTLAEGGEQIPIESPEEAVKLYGTNESPVISLTFEDEADYAEEALFCHLNDAFFGGSKFLVQLPRFNGGQKDAIDEFSPELLEKIEEIVKAIIESCIGSAMESEPRLELNSDEFESVNEMAETIFVDVLIYEGIEEDLQELERLIDEVEETRKSMIEVAYS